jgi:hypothetical protein
MSLVIEPFKNIQHCHWLIFSTDSKREVLVNTALVFTSECLLFGTFTIITVLLREISTSDILETFSTMFSLRLRQTIWNLYTTRYTELEKNIDASRTNFVDKLLSGATRTTQAEASLEILAQRATARERQSLHCNEVDKFMVL